MFALTKGILEGIARRDSYEGIKKGMNLPYTGETIRNYIWADEKRRFQFIDFDKDGNPEMGLDSVDRFFDVLVKLPDANKTDLQPRPESAAATEINGVPIMLGVNFARTLITYHVEHGPGNSPLKTVAGDRLEAAGWFEGTDKPLKVTENLGSDGKTVYNISVNKLYAKQSEYAVGALLLYEFTRYIAEKDGNFTAQDKARAVVMTGEYFGYMYCTRQESEAIMKGLGNHAKIPGLTYSIVSAAVDSDDHGYATDAQVKALMSKIAIS